MAAASALTRHLAARGHAATVIEAQNRLGGWLKTDVSLGMPLDLGASWIHRVQGNTITGLAQAIGARMASTIYDSTTTLHHVDGEFGEISLQRQARMAALQRSLNG